MYGIVEQHARPAPDHLPKLDVRVDWLCKHEVHHFADVDAGIQHVHRNGNARHVVVLELVEQPALAVYTGVLRYEHAREPPPVLGIELVE